MPKSISALRERSRFAVQYRVLTGASLWLLSCGNADHVLVPPPAADSGTIQADVTSAVNVCPVFEGSLVMPQRITPDESSSIAVRATDPDAPSSQLVFAWSAVSGTFSDSDKSTTNYRCGALGLIELRVTVRDRAGCINELRISVECVAN